MSTSDNTEHLGVRLTPEEMTALKRTAEQNGRSVSGEVRHRLRDAFTHSDTALADEITRRRQARTNRGIEQTRSAPIPGGPR